MPAAVAIPAAASLLGIGANIVGQHKAQTAQQAADEKKKAAIEAVVDENYKNNLAYQTANQGTLAGVLAAASQPQTSTSSNWNNTVQDSSQSMDFGAQGNADAAKVLQAAENAPFETNNLLAQQKAAVERNISGAQRAQNTAIGNAAAARGVDPNLMRIGADQGINAQRLNADTAINQQAYDNKRQAYGDLTSVLKNLYQTNNTHTKSNSRGGGTTTGPADYGAMLAAIRANTPVQREVVV